MKPAGGFTLVEILVALGILVLLGALAFPAVRSSMDRGRSAACLQNLRAIGAGLQSYLGEHGLIMPVMAAGRSSRDEEIPVLDTVLAPYLENEKLFHCPADRELFLRTGNSYFWNNALNGQSAANLNFMLFVEDRSKIPVVADKEGWHRHSSVRVNFLYADGHAAENLQLFTSP
jgi:prepilin-type processing-associated H-X9-DG protein